MAIDKTPGKKREYPIKMGRKYACPRCKAEVPLKQDCPSCKLEIDWSRV
jgi:hypothetical protein